MSVKTARRPRSRTSRTGTARRPTTAQRIWTLIQLRDHLASVVAAYDAHGIDGATDILLEQWATEAAILDIAPGVYEDRQPGWLEHDRRLAHTPDQPSERCHICTMNRHA